ncbi:response regulator transcription factor [Alloacidobacterium dinghuense]|uniref:Response regulator transcription factor n=1 Tax=Alloacidobacterium dinghuense TaxID=2763107 RepID=A0A7G8BD82_9BACT|nr:response regulator transcription factor [Alloacidobacterium dinghuense]QNI30502.1 response regulator transcription factor [Alloacidobacterium dinghuense]
MSDKIRVLNLDDHPVWRLGVASVINAQQDMELVAQLSTGRETIDYFRNHGADVILMDLRLPDISGIEFMIAIRTEFPGARFVILTAFARENEIRRALAEGAQAYLLKSMPSSELVDVIRQVHAGKRKIPAPIMAQLAEHYSDELLTDREVEVLRHLVDGHRNREIAERLFIAEETVKAHMRHILDKLGANDRTQALAIALRRGVIQL